MAITHAIDTPDTSNTSSYVSGSFTPAAGDLLVVFVYSAGSTIDGTLTDSAGGTYTLAAKALANLSASSLRCFVRDSLIGGSPSSMTVTFDCSGDSATNVVTSVERISGMSKAGATAVVQTAKEENVAAGATPAPAFSSAATTTNPTLGSVGVQGAVNPTPPASWTELMDTGSSTPSIDLETVGRVSGFTGTTITWGASIGKTFADIIVELDASGSGTPHTQSASITVTFTQAPVKAVHAGHSVGITLSVAPQKAVSLGRSISVTLSSAAQKAVSLSRALTTTLSVSAARTAAYQRAASIGVTLGMAATNGLVKLISATIGVTFTVSAARTMAYQLAASVAVTLSVSRQRAISLGRSVAITLSSSATRMIALAVRSVSLTFSMAAARTAAYLRSATIGVTFSMAAANGLAFFRSASLGITLTVSRTTNRIYAVAASIGATFSIAASHVFTAGGGAGETLSDWFARLGLLRK